MRKLYVSFLILLVLSLTQKAIAQNPAVVSEVEPNGTTATAQLLNLGAQNTTIIAGSVGVAGDLDWYRIDGVVPGSRFWGYVDPGGTQNAGATSRDGQIRIFAADGTTLIEFDDDDGTGNGGDATIETTLASDIGGRVLTVGGTYYIQVKAFSATGIINPYRLFVVVTPPALTAPEVEANNTAATANSIVTAAQTTGVFSGSVNPAGDFDYFSVVATAGNILYIVCDGDPGRTGANTIDGVISLIAPDGTTILISADSDFGGANASEGFSWTVLTSGTYYVRVRHFSAASTGNYQLMVSAAQPTTAPPGPCSENFDGVVVPGLPAGWSASFGATCATSARWTTVTTAFVSGPNAAFTNDPNCVSDEYLDTRPFPVNSAAAQLTFQRSNTLENGFDGMVLEISINAAPFQDILSAGGSFVTGAYNGTINTFFASPIAGRQAWTGASGGFVLTTVNLPAAANGQNIVLRFRRATDNSVGSTGVWIDNLFLTGSLCAGGCSGTPSSGAISGPATICANNPVTLTLAGHSTLIGNTIQWKSAAVSGGPYTNITGANAATYTFTPTTAGTTHYIATVTCANGGAFANTAQHTLAVGRPVHSLVSASVTTVCTPGAAGITGTVSGGVLAGSSVVGTSGTINLAIPDNNAAGVNTTITLPGYLFTNAADLKIRINANHTWVGDLIFRLTSPCGTTFLFDRPGVPASTFGNSNNLGASTATPLPPAQYTFDLFAATVIPETALASGFVPTGSYLPSNTTGASHAWAGLNFPCAAAGAWVLNVSDNGGGDTGSLVDWQILGPPVYTHTLTGPGTITQVSSTGAGNTTANYLVTNLPAGTHTFVLTSTDGIGCSVTTNVTALIKQTPIITFTPAAPTICNGTIQQISAAVNPVTATTFTQGGTTLIPAGSPLTSIGTANPYPSTLAVSGLPATGVTVKSVKLGNMNHTFPDDIDIILVSPAGFQVVLMSDAGGGAGIVGLDYTLDDAAATLMADAAFNAQGTYRPTNYGATDIFAPPGPGSVTQATPTLSSFTGNQNGTWNLYIVDDGNGDAGFMGNWSITFNIPSLVTFSPTTGLFTDPAATVAYTGTPVGVVYAMPATTTTYTGTSSVDGCTNTNTVTVTVNQVPAVTTQPTPAAQTICPGFNVTYTVVATGTGLTYQWRRNGVALVNSIQSPTVNGPTLLINNVNAANTGSYDVVITGVCPPILTTTPVTLTVATAPVISTQPLSTTVCAGVNATFTVANVGSSPAPTIFQWQVSTDAGVTWTNLLVGGSFTPTLTVTGTTTAMNNYRYRVLVTNSCGQTTTSSSATLTVNALPTVAATLLSNRICISDTLIGLSGTPVGGSWSGIGVSGFNFVPPATAIGTYNLTYSYTSTAGCTATSTIVAKVESCPERMRELDDDALVVYPNPNNGRFNVRVNSTLYNYLGMKVYNAQGQLVNGTLSATDVLTSPTYGGLVYGRVIPIDLSSLPAGVYLVKFYYDNGQRSSEKAFKVVIAGH